MKLEAIAESTTATLVSRDHDHWTPDKLEITGITCDSRNVKRGDLFAALPGSKADGARYAQQAAENGAAAILCDKDEPLTHLPQLVCKDARLGLAKAAQAFYGYADKELTLGAVTGTNGKSTTAYLVRHLLKKSRIPCGMLGTIEYDLGSEVIEAPLTTPESLDLHRYLRTMTDSGCRAAMMEASSHSLCQHRVAGLGFDAAVFTNLTQDHLDYHRTMEEYREAKAILFRNLFRGATAILNFDDPAAFYYAKNTAATVLGFSLKNAGDVRGKIKSMDIHGTRFTLHSPWGTREIAWGLVGAHNVQNCLGALAAAVSMGAKFDDCIAALPAFCGVPGRLESVGNETVPFRVLVDYAHTDDALRSVMKALRELRPSRLITVFGCGGDRDRTKRPKMGRAVEELADLGVITSDNPRTEDPNAIIGQICTGIQQQQKFMVEPDRAKAIEMAIREARPGDVVLIAGKGHENYQIFGKEKRHFSDVECAQAALDRRF